MYEWKCIDSRRAKGLIQSGIFRYTTYISKFRKFYDVIEYYIYDNKRDRIILNLKKHGHIKIKNFRKNHNHYYELIKDHICSNEIEIHIHKDKNGIFIHPQLKSKIK